MEDRLKQLKQSLKSTAFGQATFTKQRSVHQYIQKETLQQHILSLVETPKSGIDITTHLYMRGQLKQEEQEGIVYTILHEAVQAGWLQAYWEEDVKYYVLTKLGKQSLHEREKRPFHSISTLLGGHVRVE